MAEHDLTIGELRLTVQHAFFAFAALRSPTDVAHRAEVRQLLRTFVQQLELTVTGEQGERLYGTDVDDVVETAIGEVFDFRAEPPEEA